jgi:hypothetical protein
VVTLFDDQKGHVLLIPMSAECYIIAQIGSGNDIGIFSIATKEMDVEDVTDRMVLFRVDFSRKSSHQHRWKDIGRRDLHGDLSKYGVYGYSAVGSDMYFAVTHEPSERKISRQEFMRLEPLATWSHEHIVARFIREAELL